MSLKYSRTILSVSEMATFSALTVSSVIWPYAIGVVLIEVAPVTVMTVVSNMDKISPWS